MRFSKIFSALAAAAAVLFATGISAAAEQNSTKYVEGVDWTRKVVTVVGEGLVSPGTKNYTQAKGMASRAAQADAYRKLGELINGVRVEGETTVEKMLTTQDVIKLRVSATIKGAKIVDETFLSDGGYRVVMQVPLFGVSNSLAGAVFEKNASVEPFPDPVMDISPADVFATPQANESYVPVPTTPYKPPLSRLAIPSVDEIILQQVESYSSTLQEQIHQPYQAASVYDKAKSMAKKSVEEYMDAAAGNYTGLIVDCRGMGLEPVMSPVIKNTNGTKIYGHKNLDIDRVIREGMADYIDFPENATRAGENPLVVRARTLDNFNSNPVVAISDSNRILIENHATKFLTDLKVVFLFD